MIYIVYSPAGLEVIGEVTCEREDFLELRRPCATRVVETRDGPALTLDPFSVSNPDGTVKFPKATWAVMENVPKQISDAYLSATSGIQIATS